MKYYYIIRRHNDDRITNAKVYNLSKSQEEMDEIVLKHNKQNKENYYVEVKDEGMISLIEFIDNLEEQKAVTDLYWKIDNIYDEISHIRDEVDRIMEKTLKELEGEKE